jgi:hypothetical protein
MQQNAKSGEFPRLFARPAEIRRGSGLDQLGFTGAMIGGRLRLTALYAINILLDFGGGRPFVIENSCCIADEKLSRTQDCDLLVGMPVFRQVYFQLHGPNRQFDIWEPV